MPEISAVFVLRGMSACSRPFNHRLKVLNELCTQKLASWVSRLSAKEAGRVC